MSLKQLEVKTKFYIFFRSYKININLNKYLKDTFIVQFKMPIALAAIASTISD